MLTMMDVEVLELWTMAVTSTPIISPARGLDMIELLLKNFPAIFPEKQNKSWPHDRGLGGHRVATIGCGSQPPALLAPVAACSLPAFPLHCLDARRHAPLTPRP